jgi:adenylosuccinate lyase
MRWAQNDAQRIKSVEATTRHDVKAVEYFLREKVASEKDLRQAIEFLHFACTSEDVNNLAYALNLRDARAEVLLPHMDKLVAVLTDKAEAHAEEPMLSRTHGQSATPTTVGKELANYAYRLARQRELVARTPLLGKLNGAVGNYNAHLAAFPNVPWSEWGREFVQGLGLAHNPYTTQIEPHDFVAELLDHVSRLNTVALDLSRNMWLYISLGYFRQAVVGKEVGSSTMPHKVNPIDFENAEGNYGVAIAQAHHLATKLPISRMQRDLSDSTALRTLGSVFAHSVLGYKSLLLGLSKVEVNRERLQDDLNHAWQVLAEPVQTVMRRYGLDAPYEQLKDLTRGRAIDEKGMRDFIRGVQGLPDDAKQTLLGLTPASYVGLAAQQARAVRAQIEELRRRP